MPFSILNFKWVWQAHFSGHVPVTLKFYAFFIDVQMLLVLAGPPAWVDVAGPPGFEG